jgi:RNA polymerase sigma factor (sigma-70 family)
MRNITFEWHRKAQHRIKLVPIPDSELTEISPSDQSEPLCPLPTMDDECFREFLDERIVSALDALEPAFRETIMLSVSSGLNYREIAEVLGCPVGTVMSRMSRARRALRERLGVLAQSQRWVREGRS